MTVIDILRREFEGRIINFGYLFTTVEGTVQDFRTNAEGFLGVLVNGTWYDLSLYEEFTLS